MPHRSRKKPQNPDQVHSSFAFWKDDIKLLKYVTERTGLSQSELIRRLIRIAASGTRLPTLPKFPAHIIAKKWKKEFDG